MREHGIRPSMGSVASPWDNAPTESFMGIPKRECVFVNRKTDISLCRFSTLRQQVPTRFLDFRFP